jgi:acetyl-CoA acetyltransferase
VSAADRTARIVGIGETDYARWGGIQDRSEFHLACQAVLRAAGDAGIDVADIDGFTSFSNDANDAARLQAALGIPELRYASMVWGGGGGGACGAIAHAAAAVESGQANCVVAFRSLCQGQSRRFGQYNPGRVHGTFTAPFGLLAPAAMTAPLVRRHMYEFGTTSQQLGRVALACRANATRNPRAIMHERAITMDDYMGSRMIADPFRLFDCCLESDGACAVIVTTRERARDLPWGGVEILSAVHGSGPGWGSGALGSHNMADDAYPTVNASTLAPELFGRAGVTPADIDAAQIYDNFTGLVILALEDYGFSARGEGGPFVESGAIDWPNGSLPINTGGGNLSEAYVHGLNHVLEGVRQLRATSTSQVEGAEVSFICGGLGVAPTSALILGRAG